MCIEKHENNKKRNHSLHIKRTGLPPRLPLALFRPINFCFVEGKLKIICDFNVAHHAICSPHKILHKFFFSISQVTIVSTKGNWKKCLGNILWGKQIGYFLVPKTLTFKMRPSAQPFLWRWVLFAWEWKIISISKAEHLTSLWYRGPGEPRKWLIASWGTCESRKLSFWCYCNRF